VITKRYSKQLKVRDSTRLQSHELSTFIEAKSLTPVRMKKKRVLSAERETYTYIHTESINITNKSSIASSPTKGIITLIEAKSDEDQGEVVQVLKSIFETRPPTISFHYPKILNHLKENSRLSFLPLTSCKPLTFRISESFSYPCIIDVLKQAGFSEHSNYLIDIAGVIKSQTFKTLENGQKVNHFPGSSCLGRKDAMWKNIEKMMGVFGDGFDFCPITFVLPEEFRKFSLSKEENPRDLWIMKPANSACGKGIKLLNKGSNLKMTTGHVASKYVKHPHLIKGFKYDLRIYVAVTSFNPLKIYLYNEGLVRFATIPYSSKKSNLKNKCIHLTNFSINKDSPTFINNKNADEDNYGSKWSFRALRAYYEEVGIDPERIFDQIRDIIIKTLISSEGSICGKLQKYACRPDSCYELFGFDVLIDKNLKAWLLEVNIYPSLSLTSPLDSKIKYMLVTDLFNLIGINPCKRSDGKKESFEVKAQVLNKGFNINDAHLTSAEISVLAEYEDEGFRSGNFQRIFPERENLEKYKEYFLTPRLLNLLLWKFVESDRNCLKKLQRGKDLVNF
jgi:tubulin polyglutamylase TTLL4